MCGNFPKHAADRRASRTPGADGRRRPQRHFASPLVAPDLHVMHDRHEVGDWCGAAAWQAGREMTAVGQRVGWCVFMCVCAWGGGGWRGKEQSWSLPLAPAATVWLLKWLPRAVLSPACHCTCSPLPTASTASHSLPLYLCQPPRYFANDRKFCKLRPRPSGTFAGPFEVHFKRAAGKKQHEEEVFMKKNKKVWHAGELEGTFAHAKIQWKPTHTHT